MGQRPRRGEIHQHREAGLAGLFHEDRDRGLLGLLGGNRLLAGLGHEGAQTIDVALGNAVGGIECQRDLVVLARLAQLSQLPQSLGQAILGLRVRGELEDLVVDLHGLGPTSSHGMGDRLFLELALDPDGVAAGALFDFWEGQGECVLSLTAPGRTTATPPIPGRSARAADGF